jgi:hypothetical protein
MRDQLLPWEIFLLIQEILAGFIYERIVKQDVEFHYDGHNLDKSSKYSIDIM